MLAYPTLFEYSKEMTGEGSVVTRTNTANKTLRKGKATATAKRQKLQRELIKQQ